MEDAGFREPDLIAMDFPIGNKRRRPCDLKHKSVRFKFSVLLLKYSSQIYQNGTEETKSLVLLILSNCPISIPEKPSHWLAGHSKCSRHAEDSRKLLDG